MQERNSQNIPVERQQAQQRYSLQEQEQDEEVTSETVQRFNKICIQATTLMNDYKNQSIALKEQIADMVSIYQKSSNSTQAVPVQKIISITNEYQYGMRQANKQYGQLAQQLKKEQIQRDQMMFQIKQCFEKLERMQVKMKEKKKREFQLKQQQKNNQKFQQQESKPQQSEQVKESKQQDNQQKQVKNQSIDAK